MSKINVDDELTKVEKVTIIETPILQYLNELAINKIKNDDELNKQRLRWETVEKDWNDLLTGLEEENLAIVTDLSNLLKNRKTKIKELLKEDVDTNNILAKAFPKDFRFIEPDPITTEELICMNIIHGTNELGEVGEFTCVEEFETQEELIAHRKEHKANKELV